MTSGRDSADIVGDRSFPFRQLSRTLYGTESSKFTAAQDNVNQGRTAFVTAKIVSLRGGMPVRVNGEVVGAVGVAGLSKDADTEIARIAAAALSPGTTRD
jgi:uncharacterized protein GlcG (DUF336 family)